MTLDFARSSVLTAARLPLEAFPADAPWSDRFALRTRGITSSAIRELLKLTADPDIISFAGGLPAPEVFPLAEFAAAAERVLAEHGAAALQYGATEGYMSLRELLVRHMGRYGIEVTPDNVLITAGAQQALDLIGKLFINSGDRILTEEPTYLGALQAFTAYQAQYRSQSPSSPAAPSIPTVAAKGPCASTSPTARRRSSLRGSRGCARRSGGGWSSRRQLVPRG